MSVQNCRGEQFHSFITPRSPDFTIDEEASKVNGITKEDLLSKPLEQRPYFRDAWKRFTDWTNNYHLD